MKVFAFFHDLSCGGAKARTATLSFEINFSNLCCEGFAPHIANSCFPILRYVPLHHGRRDRSQLGRDEESCVITYHDESSCMTHGGVDVICTLSCWKSFRHCMASRSVVQRHRLFSDLRVHIFSQVLESFCSIFQKLWEYADLGINILKIVELLQTSDQLVVTVLKCMSFWWPFPNSSRELWRTYCVDIWQRWTNT